MTIKLLIHAITTIVASILVGIVASRVFYDKTQPLQMRRYALALVIAYIISCFTT